MRKVSDFLSRAGVAPTAETLAILAGKQPSANQLDDNGKSPFTDIGERIGGDNEALRNLLIDTGLQFRALDDLKETFGKLTNPLSRLLETLEREKFDNASLRGALNELRTSHESLRTEFETLEKKASELEGDNVRLNRDLAAVEQTAHELADEKAKLGNDISTLRVAHAGLEKQLAEETVKSRTLDDEKRLLLERADGADKRVIESDAASNLAREKHALIENERDSLQTALDQTLGQSTRTSRRLAETENSLSDARARVQQLENGLATVEEERKRLSAALDEANERRQSEIYALTLKLDAMKSRSAAAEKLLSEMRQNLVARTEEIRVVEAKLVDATVGRGAAEKKVEQLTATAEAADRQTKKLEQTRLSLSDRTKVLSETVKARDNVLAHAEDKIKSLSNRVELLKAEGASNQAKAEKRIEQLNAAIERERAERAVAEGALESARTDYARLQREILIERALRRHSAAPEDAADANQAREPMPPKNGNGSGHGAKPENGAA
jgi:chromosome segregation ATPase